MPLIRRYAPGAGILVVSLHTQPVYVKKMFQNGAAGYMIKNFHHEEMIQALLEVQDGHTYVCKVKNNLAPGLEHSLENRIHSLFFREMKMVEFIRQGYSSRELAAVTHLSKP